MKKQLNKLFAGTLLLALMTIFFVSCDKGKVDFLQVKGSSVTLTATKPEASVELLAKNDWRVDGKGIERGKDAAVTSFGWFTVSPGQGKGNTSVKIKLVDAKKPVKDTSHEIFFTSKGRKVKVTVYFKTK